jgi:hypothetical protein
MTPQSDGKPENCPCGLPLDAPASEPCWRPSTDRDPGPPIYFVARYGDDRAKCLFVRTATGSGWVGIGSAAPSSDTAPMPWEQVGVCSEGVSHPVVNSPLPDHLSGTGINSCPWSKSSGVWKEVFKEMQMLDCIDAVFESEAVVDDMVSAVDRYLRKPAGSSDQGYREGRFIAIGDGAAVRISTPHHL